MFVGFIIGKFIRVDDIFLIYLFSIGEILIFFLYMRNKDFFEFEVIGIF